MYSQCASREPLQRPSLACFPCSVGLLLDLGTKSLDNSLHHDAKNHQRFEAEEADPDSVENAFFVAVDVASHLLEQNWPGADDQKQDFQNVEGVPIGSVGVSERTRKDVRP